MVGSTQKDLDIPRVDWSEIRRPGSPNFVVLDRVPFGAFREIKWIPRNEIPFSSVLSVKPRHKLCAGGQLKHSIIPAIAITHSIKDYVWDLRCLSTKIIKLIRNEHTICLRVLLEVVSIDRPIGVAVVRIGLPPFTTGWVAVIDVVADHHSAAPISDRSFVEELRTRPVFIE